MRRATERTSAGPPAADRREKQTNERQSSEPAGQEKQQPQKLASLAPASDNAAAAPSGIDLVKTVQSELRRVGCMSGRADGDWNATSQRSLTLFNKYAGTHFDSKFASADALETIRGRANRVCPLVCDHGFKADGDNCVKITCRAGYQISDDNECVRTHEKRPAAIREEPQSKRDAERRQIEAKPPKPQASGQIFCSQIGCKPVRPNCHITGRSFGVGIKEVLECN